MTAAHKPRVAHLLTTDLSVDLATRSARSASPLLIEQRLWILCEIVVIMLLNMIIGT